MTARRETGRLAPKLAAGVALAAITCCSQASARTAPRADQEIAPFRLTGVEGYVLARYLADDSFNSRQLGSAGTRTRQSNLIEEVFLLTHSYVYHPTLLTLDLGVGPILDRSRYELDGRPTDGDRQLYNLRAQATVLRDKPYNAALFYDRQNQNQSLGPALEVLTENSRYGARLSLRNPVTPVPLGVELTRSDNRGRGGGQTIDDRINQVRLTTAANIGKIGTSNFHYLRSHQESLSGSASLALRPSQFDSSSAYLDTRLKLGDRDQYDLVNTIVRNSNNYTVGEAPPTQLRDFNFGLDLRGRQSDDVQTYGRYNFISSKQREDSLQTNSAGGGISYRFSPAFSGALAMRGEVGRGTHLDSSLYAIDGSAQYQQTLPLGQATVAYAFSYGQRDQRATALQSRILGERMTLAGTTAVTLGKQQIVARTVVVSNLTRSQVFVEGQDYLLFQLGLNLRVQRLVGGNILDGQEVLVDYDFGLGGSYALSQLDNSISFNWAYKNLLSMLARYADSAPRLESGAPTIPLNPGSSILYSFHAELPFSLLWQRQLLGANAERENRREVILPYRRANYETYVQVDLPLVESGSIRIGLRKQKVDYGTNQAQDVNLRAYDLRLWLRLANEIDVSVDATRERDTGTPVVRKRSFRSARAQWRQRKLVWTFNLTRNHELQGPAESKRTFGQMSLRRDF